MTKEERNIISLGSTGVSIKELFLVLIIPIVLIALDIILYAFGYTEAIGILIFSGIAFGIISASLLSENNKISIYLIVPTIVIVFLVILNYYEFLDALWGFILSLIALGVGIVINVIDKQHRSAFILTAYIIGFWIVFNVLEMIFNISIWELIGLAVDGESDVFWAIRMCLFSFFIVPVIYFINKDVRSGLREDIDQLMSLDPKQKRILLYGLAIIIAVIVADILIIYYVVDVLVMMIALFCATFITLMPLTFLLSRSKDIGEGLDKITIAITMLIGTLLAPLILIIVVIPMWEGNLGGFGGIIFNLISSQEQYGGIFPAQGGVNYFSYVFYILLQSPAPALMIGFMIFGAVTVMVAQNIGGVGSILGGFATSVVVIVPMIFIFEIFAGGIAPPELLVDILGLGTASFVFGIAETSAFILMLSIIAVFISAGKLLGRLVA